MDPSFNNQPQPGAGTTPTAQPQYAVQSGMAMPVQPQSFDASIQIQQNPAPAMPQQAQPVAQQQYQPPNVPAAVENTYQPPILNFQERQPAPTAAPPAPTVTMPPSASAGNAPSVKSVQSNPNSTQNTLQVAEIRDGIVIMNDGSFRSVVMVKSINFDLMSPQEQEAVEYSYQGFLNSLYFPVQIFIRSEKVDLQPYIEKLDKIRSEHDNMLLALLMNDYISYIDQLAQQTNIMDKKFYIVIPFFPHVDVQKALSQSKNFMTGLAGLFNNKDQHVVINEDDLEKAKTELRNRVQSVLSGLLQSNIQGLPLDTQELIELFYDTYNPDTATRQQLKNFDSLTADVITKGQGATVQPHMKTELN